MAMFPCQTVQSPFLHKVTSSHRGYHQQMSLQPQTTRHNWTITIMPVTEGATNEIRKQQNYHGVLAPEATAIQNYLLLTVKDHVDYIRMHTPVWAWHSKLHCRSSPLASQLPNQSLTDKSQDASTSQGASDGVRQMLVSPSPSRLKLIV